MMAVRAQEYKVSKTNGKMIINLSNVVVEGYGGNEIVFSYQKAPAKTETDPRENGLQAINSAGYRDNTGLGISVVDKGGTVEVNEVARWQAIKILVPKDIILSFTCHQISHGDVVCRSMDNEIDVETDYNKVLLENVTGPVVVRSLYGSVDAVFNENIKGPVSIACIHSTVDVTIPVDTKANLKLNSTHSIIMASPDFKMDVVKNEADSMAAYGTSINGKLNGGGTDFRLSSEFGKVYLRKML
jgi:hypothetical protein